MTTYKITVEIDDSQLASDSNQSLAFAWHAAQRNPAPHGDPVAGRLVERIGREIIRRWLRGIDPELWHHRGESYYRDQLTRLARYEPPAGAAPGSPEWQYGTWVLREDAPSASAVDGAERQARPASGDEAVDAIAYERAMVEREATERKATEDAGGAR